MSASGANSDQTLRHAMSDLVQHCLLRFVCSNILGKFKTMLTRTALITTVADGILIFADIFQRKIRLGISCESSVRRRFT